MSLYKTQRCRHFDEAGNPIKPYCSQGNRCRFIHPNDHQWTKLKRRIGDTPSPEHREAARLKGENKLHLAPGSPFQRQHSSPLVPKTDLFKRKQKDSSRERDQRDWSTWNGDRRHDSDSLGYARERDGTFGQGYSLKRAHDTGDQYPNQRPRLSERTHYGSSVSHDGNHQATQTNKNCCPVSRVSAHDLKATKVSDTFRHLAKLCCEIMQDTCFLDREEDKIKAFTGLSSELSRAVPDAAMAVTPTLATVMTGRTRTRERLENHLEELEALWKTLFSMLEYDISKAIDSRLEKAITLIGNERDNALRMITRSQRLVGGRLHDGTMGPRKWPDGWRETATDKTAALSERSMMLVSDRPTINASPKETRHHEASTSLSLVPTQEVDLGTSLRIVLEDMKTQMDRQTRAIELLAKENLQLKSAAENLNFAPQLVPPDSIPSSPRKPPIL